MRRWGLGVAVSAVAAVLAAGSLVVQPSLATIYGISALACLLAVGSNERWSVPLSAFVLVMSGLTAWSGVVAGAFPLPVPLVIVVALAAGAWAGAGNDGTDSGSLPRLRGAIAAGLAAAVVLLHPALESRREVIASDLRIVAGGSVSIPLPAGVDVVRLEISGGNVAGLGGGVAIGRVMVEPGGESRDLHIGDVADWGARRREHFLAADNRQPLEPAGPVFGRGREAFLSGAGIVRIDANEGRTLTIEALPTIGEDGRLLVAVVEVQR
jgi:hypothetical protein